MTLASARLRQKSLAAVTIIAKDSFVGTAASALTAHTMDVGAGWTLVVAGNSYLITGSNQAYLNGNQNGGIGTNTGAADCTVSADVINAGDQGVMVRGADANNYISVSNSGGVYKKVAGTFTGPLVTFAAGSAGDNLKVTMSGSAFTIFRNGAQIATFTETAGQTNTIHGLVNGQVTAPIWDNFLVTVP